MAIREIARRNQQDGTEYAIPLGPWVDDSAFDPAVFKPVGYPQNDRAPHTRARESGRNRKNPTTPATARPRTRRP